jgi:hypothetical protein
MTLTSSESEFIPSIAAQQASTESHETILGTGGPAQLVPAAEVSSQPDIGYRNHADGHPQQDPGAVA